MLVFLKKIYKGEIKLVTVYWVYGVLVSTVASILLLALLDFANRPENDNAAVAVGVLLILAAFFAYLFILHIGIWRSSEKYKGPIIWNILAKIAVVVSAVSVVSGFFI